MRGNYMAKPKRGKHIKEIPNWRGTCPVCERTGVKLLWTRMKEDKSQLSVCKRCGS
jgi:hypothetical protein